MTARPFFHPPLSFTVNEQYHSHFVFRGKWKKVPDQQQLSLMSHVTVSKCVGHGVAGDHSLFLSNESILLSHLISRNNNHYVYFGRLDRKRMSVTTRCSRTGIRMNNLFLLLCQPWTNYSQQSIIIIIIIISFDFLIVSELSCHNTVIIIITTVTTTIIPRDLAVRMRHL